MEKKILKEDVLWSFIENDLNGDLSLFKNFLELFKELYAEDFLSIIDSTDKEKIKACAHKIKSSCRLFGAEQLESEFLVIEKNVLSLNPKDLQEKLALVDQIFKDSLLEIEKIAA